jgi:hypothetical protein
MHRYNGIYWMADQGGGRAVKRLRCLMRFDLTISWDYCSSWLCGVLVAALLVKVSFMHGYGWQWVIPYLC